MRLRVKLLALFLALSLLPLGLAGGYFIVSHRSDMIQLMEEDFALRAEDMAYYVEEWLAEHRTHLVSLAELQAAHHWGEEEELREGLKQQTQLHPAMRHLVVLDDKGKLVTDTGEVEGEVYEELGEVVPAVELEAAMARALGGEVAATLVHQEGNLTEYFLLAPIVLDNGTVAGVLVAEILLTPLEADMLHWARETGDSAESYLFDKEGRLLTRTRNGGPGLLEPMTASEAVREVLVGRNGSGRFTDYRGVEVVGAYYSLPGMEWGLVVKQDEAEVLAPVNEFVVTTGLVLLLAGLAAVAAALLLTPRLLRPVEELAGGARRVGRGDYGEPVGVAGTDELGELAGAFNAMQAQIREHTEELEAQVAERTAELATANAMLEGFFNYAPNAIMVVSKKGFIERVNTQVERMFGYSREELVGQPVEVLIPGRFRDSHVKQRHHYMAAPSNRPMGAGLELYGRRKDGSDFPVDISLGPLETKEGVVVLAIIRDVTDRRQAEAALRESEARFRGAFENAAVGVTLVDPEGRFVRANQALCNLLGYTEAELRAKTFSEVTHPDDIRTGVYEKKRMLLGEAERAKFEKRYIHKQGHEIWALVSPSLVRDADGKPLYFVTQVQDITERKRAEAALKEHSAHLEEMVAERTHELVAAQEALVRKEKLALLGQLAGSVSHELRNPLGVISNAIYYLQTISRDADAKTREYLAIIADEVRQSEAIITGLLDFGRLQTPQRAPAVVAQLVEQTLAKESPPPEVEVTTELPSDLPEVAVDARQVRQILVNLISNACQAMPGGGQLTVAARPHDEQVLLTVTDTGRGIAPENLEQVFEPLFTTRARGIGLGLALSRQFAEAGGGSLTVASEPGKGTTFTLALPLSEAD